jgi:hypothetical protein
MEDAVIATPVVVDFPTAEPIAQRAAAMRMDVLSMVGELSKRFFVFRGAIYFGNPVEFQPPKSGAAFIASSPYDDEINVICSALNVSIRPLRDAGAERAQKIIDDLCNLTNKDAFWLRSALASAVSIEGKD